MRSLRRIFLLLRAVFQRRRVERELDAELAAHLEAETAELIAAGLSPEQARRQARATMGSLPTISDQCRDARGTAGWDSLRQDVRFGARVLRRSPTFAAVSVLVAAIGTGSAVAGFSLVDQVLFRPLPYPQPERLVQIDGVGGMRGPFETLRSNARLARYAAHQGLTAFTAAADPWPERIEGSVVSANFFQVLGAAPILGRTFDEGEDRRGAPRVAVLSHRFWTERFVADPGVLGQGLTLDEHDYKIVGVMPPGFDFPAREARLWIPMQLDPEDQGAYWGASGLWVFARVVDGVGLAQAEAELRTWIPQIRDMFPWRMPDRWGAGAQMVDLKEALTGDARASLLLLFGVVVLVWMAAVVNVGSLVVGHATSRTREFALRSSLGASRTRLWRQLLTESALLAGLGGILGLAVAAGELLVLKRLLPSDVPRLLEASLDVRAVAAAFLATVLTATFLAAASTGRGRGAAAAADRSTPPRGARRTNGALVTLEAAFAVVLLVGAGLLLRSLWEVLQVDAGFRVESVVTADLHPDQAGATSPEAGQALFDRVREQVRGLPGVEAVAAVYPRPLSEEVAAVTVALEDHPRPAKDPQLVFWSSAATEGLFEALEVPILHGRSITEADVAESPPVAWVTRATAERFWPGESPIGRRLRPVWEKEWRTVVGVVGDLKNYKITGPPDWVDGEIFLPLPQAVSQPKSLALVFRVAGPVGGLASELRDQAEAVCPGCAVSRFETMERVTARASKAPRSLAWLVAGFAGVALLLACAGVFGVVAQSLEVRSRELGVRVALGASRMRVAWLLLLPSLRQTLVGALIGLFAAWALSGSIRSLLFGIAPTDPIGFLAAPAALCLATAIGCAAPILRAIRTDPAQTLRET